MFFFCTLRPTQWSVMIMESLIAAALSITLFLIHNGFFVSPADGSCPFSWPKATKRHHIQSRWDIRCGDRETAQSPWSGLMLMHTHTPDYCLATGGNNTLCSDSQTHIWIHPCRIQMHTYTRMLINGQTKSLHSQSQTCLLWDNRATNGKCNFFYIIIYLWQLQWHHQGCLALFQGFRCFIRL